MKAAKGVESKWPEVVHAVFWAERITVSRMTGRLPYYLAHGVEPLLPFNISEATYMVPVEGNKLTTGKLLGMRVQQLLKREEDLRQVHNNVLKARWALAKAFKKAFRNTIADYNFAAGALVLIRNLRFSMELDCKSKPRYLGPYVVVRKNCGGAYVLAELDGAIMKKAIAAARVIPYFARKKIAIPIVELTERTSEELENLGDEESDQDQPKRAPNSNAEDSD